MADEGSASRQRMVGRDAIEDVEWRPAAPESHPLRHVDAVRYAAVAVVALLFVRVALAAVRAVNVPSSSELASMAGLSDGGESGARTGGQVTANPTATPTPTPTPTKVCNPVLTPSCGTTMALSPINSIPRAWFGLLASALVVGTRR